MRILVAPDKFKGTLDSPGVAEAIARGARIALPASSMTLRPVADGGEGTLDALLYAAGGRVIEMQVTGPLGGRSDLSIGYLNDGRVVMEVAQAAGLTLVHPKERRCLDATSRGLGDAFAAVLEDSRVKSVVVGVGGTASTDGGTGAAGAVGWRFLNRRGQELPPGGGALVDLARIDGHSVVPALADVDVMGACDVVNPLVGEEGTARVFGPQKGASEPDVAVLEQAIETLSQRIEADLGIDISTVECGGAGGGLGAGLVAFFGARLGRGFDVVAEAIGLEEAVQASDLVITGEGRLDEQSLGGKAPIGVAQLAARARLRCLAVSGEVLVDPKKLKMFGIKAAGSLVETVGSERAMADPAGSITETTTQLVRRTLKNEIERGGRPERTRF